MATPPHADPKALCAALSYEAVESVLTTLTAEELQRELLAALGRSWPSGQLPGPPEWYDASGGPDGVLAHMEADRAEGLVPLLLALEVGSPEEADEALTTWQRVAAKAGVWLHAEVAARHGWKLEGLWRADSISFAVPGPETTARRVFATRHARILDERFREALGEG